MTTAEINQIRERSKLDNEIIVGSEVRQLCGMGESLLEIRAAWTRVAGFAVCESIGDPDPERRRYRITIDYSTLEKAQDAYQAMGEITEALTKEKND